MGTEVNDLTKTLGMLRMVAGPMQGMIKPETRQEAELIAGILSAIAVNYRVPAMELAVVRFLADSWDAVSAEASMEPSGPLRELMLAYATQERLFEGARTALKMLQNRGEMRPATIRRAQEVFHRTAPHLDGEELIVAIIACMLLLESAVSQLESRLAQQAEQG